ncbi:hypothetical protein BDA96_09G275500 [Sorghum bicolor]|uniref:Reticulon-like protein n=1 Tax=Sorghum bicolor TaxID=4558 RepID=A0A921U640_SORBI|nr:reticulon-like protein B12 isoform X2 [Sorghum bicolor]KAG0519579.1 hypothetical protein BDA96_09G275500 [Sorghum bicolor]|eukprot:XP_002441647.1 reticulon-like protein B12 isoform X2 [Sorghum bicolor]
MMDARIATAGVGVGGGAGTCAAGGFVWDVLLWRRGRADVSACLLAATVSSWLLFYGGLVRGYTLLSLASSVLLLLLTVLFLWAKAARLLNRPQPPVPELRVPQQAVDDAAALLRSALDAALDAFRDIALGRDSLLFYRAFLCLWSVSIVGSLTDFPTACYASIVAALTIPALYHRHQECIRTYMSFAYMNLRMYEMVYERLSMKCFLRIRDWVMELLKDP